MQVFKGLDLAALIQGPYLIHIGVWVNICVFI